MARRIIRFSALLLALLVAEANAANDIDALLARAQPPAGLLLEVVTGDEDALERLLPRAAAEARRLRERFPGVEIVLLTHGSEQFALLAEEQHAQSAIHGTVRALVADNIPVEVCGNHASWRGKGDADFPDYVVVASSASSQLARYRARGFEVIRLR